MVVVEEEVEEELGLLAGLLVAYPQRELAPDEREPAAHLHQEILHVVEKRLFEVALLRIRRQVQELEVVGVLESVADKLGVRRRKRPVEGRERRPMAASQVARDLRLEHLARAAVFGGIARVPKASIAVPELVEEDDVVTPGQFGSRLLQHRGHALRRPRARELAHVAEIPRRQALHVGELPAEVRRQPLNHLRPPPRTSLARKDAPTYLPIRREHGGVHGEERLDSCGRDSRLDLVQELEVIGRELLPGAVRQLGHQPRLR